MGADRFRSRRLVALRVRRVRNATTLRIRQFFGAGRGRMRNGGTHFTYDDSRCRSVLRYDWIRVGMGCGSD